jgi:hypothetical protein
MAKIYKEIISFILKASHLAETLGIKNILQPGLVKEMMIADILNHKLIYSKNDADACDHSNPEIKFEYLSCLENGTGQLDRIFSRPIEKRKKSLQRITRNSKIYLAIFFRENQLKVKNIYEIESQILLKEVEEQLNRSTNDISHIGITEKWAIKNGKRILSYNL